MVKSSALPRLNLHPPPRTGVDLRHDADLQVASLRRLDYLVRNKLLQKILFPLQTDFHVPRGQYICRPHVPNRYREHERSSCGDQLRGAGKSDSEGRVDVFVAPEAVREEFEDDGEEVAFVTHTEFDSLLECLVGVLEERDHEL